MVLRNPHGCLLTQSPQLSEGRVRSRSVPLGCNRFQMLHTLTFSMSMYPILSLFDVAIFGSSESENSNLENPSKEHICK